MKKIIIFGIVLFLYATLVYAVSTDDNDLVGYWELDEAGSVFADSKDNGHPNIALVYSGALQQQTAIAPTSTFSLGFDNVNDQAINTSQSTKDIIQSTFTGGVTFGCWATSAGAGDDAIISMTGQGGSGAGAYELRETNDGSGTLTILAQAQWYGYVPATHFPGTLKLGMYNNSRWQHYVNDTMVKSTAAAGPPFETSDGIFIGSSSFSADTASFDGTIDDCFIINRSLNSAEITDIVNNGITAPVVSNPPTNSSWNVTSNNLVLGENSTVWEIGGTINITSDLLSFTFETDINANCSVRADVEQNYSEMIAADISYKLATTDTTDHAGTLADALSEGNHCMYASCISEEGYGYASGVSMSGCLNVTYTPVNTLVFPTRRPEWGGAKADVLCYELAGGLACFDENGFI